MAEVNILKLKKQAVSLGMTKDDAKKASRPVLEAFISGASKGSDEGKSENKVTKKKSVAKKKTSTKKAPTEKSSKTTSKKKTTKAAKAAPKTKAKAKPKNDENGDLGRLTIGAIDWTVESDEWNPRVGGPVERLFKALKKAKGNIDKAFDALSDDMYDFVGKKKRDGSKRTKAEAEAMLRYRLNRTKFEYARRTGQHESATNRAEYGTGDYAKTKKRKTAERKPNRKATSSKKKTASVKKGKKRSKK